MQKPWVQQLQAKLITDIRLVDRGGQQSPESMFVSEIMMNKRGGAIGLIENESKLRPVWASAL